MLPAAACPQWGVAALRCFRPISFGHRFVGNAPCQCRFACPSTACHLNMIWLSPCRVFALFFLSCVSGSTQIENCDLPLHASISKGLHLATRTWHIAYSALITSSPQIQHQALIARGSVETCGYVSGNIGLPCAMLDDSEGTCQTDLSVLASPLKRPKGYTSTSTVGSRTAWAYCDQIRCFGNYNVCNDYGADLWNGLDLADFSADYTSILSW